MAFGRKGVIDRTDIIKNDIKNTGETKNALRYRFTFGTKVT